MRETDRTAERVTAVEGTVSILRDNIAELTASIRILSAQVGTIGKANYPLYIAGIGMTITLVGAILYPFVQNIRKLEESDMRHYERMSALEKVEAISEQRIKELEERR